mgnify:CR=1 FL=1
MAKPIISVENLSKKYALGEKQNFYTLRDSITGFFSGKKKKEEEFWALKDINFEEFDQITDKIKGYLYKDFMKISRLPAKERVTLTLEFLKKHEFAVEEILKEYLVREF